MNNMQTRGPTPPPSHECAGEGYFRDPEDCAVYYVCVPNGDQWSVYTFTCPPGTVFDLTTNNCNYPEFVPGCEVSKK